MRLDYGKNFGEIEKIVCRLKGKRFGGLGREGRESLEWSWRNDPMTVDPRGILQKGREVFYGLWKTGTRTLGANSTPPEPESRSRNQEAGWRRSCINYYGGNERMVLNRIVWTFEIILKMSGDVFSL